MAEDLRKAHARRPAPTRRLRALPAVEQVLQQLGATGLPRAVVVAFVRRELARWRTQATIPDAAMIVAGLREQLRAFHQTRLQPVINGTGVLLHTNLGRAPLPPAVVATLAAVAANYSTVEYDLAAGERGGRAGYLEHNLALVCQAPAATVTNNCAAALLLILRHFVRAPRCEVIISRGELVQIGGGFRIPDILEASGAVLREVGTTNKTALSDYARAIGRNTALILKVHRSNFFMGGFVESPATEDIAALARRQRVPCVEDLGSGAVVATEKLAALDHEPTPGEVLKRGMDLVCFSGDKLLGGPQAGIIAGRARFVAALQREPFFRALRCDKLILSALQTTVDLYLHGTAAAELPALAMMKLSCADLRPRAEAIVAALAGTSLRAHVGTGQSQVGGGTLPQAALPSVTVALTPAGQTLAELAARLRLGAPPVVGVISGGRYQLDLRTVFPAQDAALIAALQASAVVPNA